LSGQAKVDSGVKMSVSDVLPALGAGHQPRSAMIATVITVCGRKCSKSKHFRPQTVMGVALLVGPGAVNEAFTALDAVNEAFIAGGPGTPAPPATSIPPALKIAVLGR